MKGDKGSQCNISANEVEYFSKLSSSKLIFVRHSSRRVSFERCHVR